MTEPSATNTQRFNGLELAAGVGMVLGTSASAKFIKGLEEAAIAEITRIILKFKSMPTRRQEELLDAARQEVLALPRVKGLTRQAARDLIIKLLDDGGVSVADPAKPSISLDSPFSFLLQFPPAAVAHELRMEHPQTVAMILSRLTPEFSGRVLASLRTAQQVHVAQAMANPTNVAPDLLAGVERTLKQRFRPPERPRI